MTRVIDMEQETADEVQEEGTESKEDTDELMAQDTDTGSRLFDLDHEAEENDTGNCLSDLDQEVMSQETDTGNRLSDLDQEAIPSADTCNEEFKDETSCAMIEESSGKSKRRYDREFLLQLQYDSLVSKRPITLPDISDIERHSRKYKKELYRSEKPRHKTNNYSGKYDRQNIYRNEQNSNTVDDGDTWSVGSKDLSSRETILIDNTCFIVVEEIDDKTENEKSNHAKNTDAYSEFTSLKTGVEEKIRTENEHKSEISLKGRAHKEHSRTWDNEKGMKRNLDADRNNDMSRKRRRSFRDGSSGRRTTGHNFHKTIGYKEKSYHSRSRSMLRRPYELHSEKAAHHRVKGVQEAGRKYLYKVEDEGGKATQQEKGSRHSVDCPDTLSKNRPALYENGKQVDTQSEKEIFPIQEHLENQLSPVSDRSISPYSDFTGFFQNNNEENLNQDKVDSEVNNPQNIVTNGMYTEQKEFQNVNIFPIGGLQGDQFLYKNYFENRVNGYGSGLQSFPQPFIGKECQTQPYFQGQVRYPRNEMSSVPFMNGHRFPIRFQESFQPFQNNLNAKNRGQQSQNNITVKERVPTQNKAAEYFLVSTSTNNALSMDIQNKILTAMYKAMIKSDERQFSPRDVIDMMKRNRPIQIEFETKAALFDLLKHKEDKFTVQNDGRLISLKTNIKICSRFTNNPSFEHSCMDLHICKYFLLGRCPWNHCKFSHNITSKHNVKVFESNGLGGLNEKHVIALMRDLNSRNISTTPLICKFYNNEGGCKKDDYCMHLHLCTHFITNNCKFGRQCRRSHDIYDKQTRTVLEMHGLFPNGLNHARIILLLKSTLEDGEVKLKRELSNLPKVNTDASTNGPLNNIHPSSPNANLLAADTIENVSLADTHTESMESKKPNHKVENGTREQMLFSDFDKLLGQPNSGTAESKNCKHDLKNLPEFIPLEFIKDAEDENSRTDVMNDVNSFPKTDLQKLGDDREPTLDDKVIETDVVFIRPKEKSETENMLQETPRLPIWKPLRHEMKENEKDKPKSVQDKDSNKFILRNTHNSSETDQMKTDNSLQHENGNSDHSTNYENVTSYLPPDAGEYNSNADDENWSKQKQGIMIEMTNEHGRYRIRKKENNWQLQSTTTHRTETETPSVLREASWIQTTVAESDTLDNIYRTFNELIGRKFSVTPNIGKSDE